ncbi:hypothetical protein N9B73_00345 [Verrucomicrobiales bacterium]|nr:hypothetical protein [Verrucomicrobiales bacterium]
MERLTDEHIEEVGVYLDVKYDKRELRLEFVPPVDKNAIFELNLDNYEMFCRIESFEIPRIILPGAFSLLSFISPG